MITREKLEQHAQTLRAAVERLEADLIANRGALQMVEALLTEDAEEDAAVPAD